MSTSSDYRTAPDWPLPGSTTLRFSLTPQPVVLKPGERLRLNIDSRTDLLRSDVSHGHAQFDLQVPPYFARNTLHYGPDSDLELRRAAPDGAPIEPPPHAVIA